MNIDMHVGVQSQIPELKGRNGAVFEACDVGKWARLTRDLRARGNLGTVRGGASGSLVRGLARTAGASPPREITFFARMRPG